jgi:sugar-specific transcriptional regulator TrmB
MYEGLLLRLGLNENEARMYELLLSRGETKARDLLEGSGLGRGNVYNILTSLVARGLAEISPGKQQHYKATDPSRLRTLAELRRRQVEAVEGELLALLPGITSLYNLSTGRPVVEVFEGLEGIRQALMDTLEQNGEILTYLDAAALEGPMVEVNKEYVAARLKKKVPKRVLVADTPEYRAIASGKADDLTQVRYLTGFPDSFATAVQIYRDRLLYTSYKNDKYIAIIIRDRAMYDMHHQMFEWQWRQAAS